MTLYTLFKWCTQYILCLSRPHRLVVQDTSFTEGTGIRLPLPLRKEVDHGFPISLKLKRVLPGSMPERLMGTDYKFVGITCSNKCHFYSMAALTQKENFKKKKKKIDNNKWRKRKYQTRCPFNIPHYLHISALICKL